MSIIISKSDYGFDIRIPIQLNEHIRKWNFVEEVKNH